MQCCMNWKLGIIIVKYPFAAVTDYTNIPLAIYKAMQHEAILIAVQLIILIRSYVWRVMIGNCKMRTWNNENGTSSHICEHCARTIAMCGFVQRYAIDDYAIVCKRYQSLILHLVFCMVPCKFILLFGRNGMIAWIDSFLQDSGVLYWIYRIITLVI